MKKLVRYELNAIYRHPDDAFGAMDMEGKGYIDTNDFIKAQGTRRIITNFNDRSPVYKIEI